MAKAAADGKVDDYAPWSIAPKDFKPLSFTTLGEWDGRTLDYFRNLAQTMAGNSRKEAGKLFRRMREKIAVAIIVGQGQVVREV